MKSAGTWQVDRQDRRTALMRKKMDASKKKKNEMKIMNIVREEGASYQMMMDTLNDPKRRIIDLKIEDMVDMSHQRIADTFKTAEETAAIEVKSIMVSVIAKHHQQVEKLSVDESGISIDRDSANKPVTELNRLSPSDKSISDRSKKVGNDEEEEYMEEDEDWSGDEEQRGGNVNAAPRNSFKLNLDSTLQQNRRASLRDGIKLEHVLNFGGGFHDDEEPRTQWSSGDDGDLWRRIVCTVSIVMAYFIVMIMIMEDEDEFICYCRIETNNLYSMCFEFVSPFLLRTSKKHNDEQQQSPLPTKAINNKHTPAQHAAASNQQKIAAIAGKEMQWIKPLLPGAAVEKAALCCAHQCMCFYLCIHG